MDLYHYLFKFIIVGDTNVGKSCLLLNYTEKKYREEHDTTIGVEFGSSLYKHQDKTIKIQIWDTAGQESFRSITRSYYKGSIGVVLVFDITNKESFYSMIKWYNEVIESTHEKVSIMLVGNKIDLEDNRAVPLLEAQEFADQYKIKYMETSAKTSQNVDQLFEGLALEVLDKIDKNQLDFTQDGSKQALNWALSTGKAILAPKSRARRKEDAADLYQYINMLPILIIAFFFFLELTSHKVVVLFMSQQKEELNEEQQQVEKGVELMNRISEKKAEVLRMEGEAQSLNTPSTFAKYSKIQRQINTQKNQIEQLEQELCEISSKTEEKQKQKGSGSGKEEKEKQLVLITNFCLLMTLALILKGTYYNIPSIQYDQLKPLGWIIAKQAEDPRRGVDISMSIWAVWSFNFIRIIKATLGYD